MSDETNQQPAPEPTQSVPEPEIETPPVAEATLASAPASGEKSKEKKEEENKFMAVLAYLGILVIIPLMVARDRPFVKFHIKQGLLLVIGWALVWAIQMVYIPFNFLASALWFVIFVLTVLGILNAVSGKEKELPVIGQYGSRFDSFFE
jgi:uncharacterized membrane protein